MTRHAKLGGVRRHLHLPADAGFTVPSSAASGRTGTRSSAFTRRATCVSCGREIRFVPASGVRMEYWRAV